MQNLTRISKNAPIFLFPRRMGKENIAVHKKCLPGKNIAIFG